MVDYYNGLANGTFEQMKNLLSKAWLLCLLVACITSKFAQAATVNALSNSKSMVSLTSDPEENFKAKDKICIIGPQKKKLACGTVLKVKGGTKIIVKIPNKNELSALKKGMKARIEKVAGSGSEGDEIESPGTETTGSKKAPFRVAAGWLSALSLPASYNQVSYLPPEGNAPTTIWKTESKMSSGILPPSYIGFGGEIGIPIGSKALSLGAKYQVFQSTIYSSNYQTDLTDPYVSTQTSGGAFGTWADFTFLRKNLTKKLALNTNAGAGFDLYSVSVKAKKLTEPAAAASAALQSLLLADATTEGTPIITGSAKLGILSLRAGARVEFQIVKHLGLSIGTTVILPLAAMMNSSSVEVADGEDRGIADTKADFKQGLGLAKKSFALDVLIGTYASF